MPSPILPLPLPRGQALVGIVDAYYCHEGAKAAVGVGPASRAADCLGLFSMQGGKLVSSAAIAAGAAPVLRAALSRWVANGAPAEGAGWDPSSPALLCADAIFAITTTDDDPRILQLLFKVRTARPPRSWGARISFSSTA